MLEHGIFFYQYNLLATTYVYGRFRDGQTQGYGGVKTTGSSVTVNAVTAGIGTFSPVQIADIVKFIIGDPDVAANVLRRRVATKPSNDQITVDTAVNLDNGGLGYPAWFFRNFLSGTGVADGWLPVQKFGPNKAVRLMFPTIGDAGGFDVSIETKGFELDTAPIQIFEKHYDQGAVSPKDGEHIEIPEHVASVRVGLKGTAGFANVDDISAFLIGDPNH